MNVSITLSTPDPDRPLPPPAERVPQLAQNVSIALSVIAGGTATGYPIFLLASGQINKHLINEGLVSI